MGDQGGAAIMAIILFAIALYLIAIAIAIAVVVALIALGIVSIWASKSGGKSLVPQEGIATALLSSVGWAGALSVGCMLGSFGLLVALEVGFGKEFTRSLASHYQMGPNGGLNLLFLYEWILRDSYKFALNLALVLFVGNRIHVMRTKGGLHWLAVIPPLFAMVLSFFLEHGEAVIRFLESLSQADARMLIVACVEEFLVPFEMVLKAFYAPSDALAWAHATLLESHGSIFRLATYFPWIFLVVTVAYATRHMLMPPDSGGI